MTLTGESIAAYTALLSTAAAGLVALFKWIFTAQAERQMKRRADLTDLIERQEEEIEALRGTLRTERSERDTRETALEERVRQAEHDRTIAEGLLWRIGWAKTPHGWKPENGGGVKP